MRRNELSPNELQIFKAQQISTEKVLVKVSKPAIWFWYMEEVLLIEVDEKDFCFISVLLCFKEHSFIKKRIFFSFCDPGNP